MNVYLFVITLGMSVVATAFVLKPLVLSLASRSSGYARTSLLSIVVVPLLAIGLYAAIGRPGAVGHSSNSANSSQPSATSPPTDKIASVTSLLAGLEQRLAKNPADGDGWLLLAKSYQHLGRVEEALTAYEKGAALGHADPSVAASLAAVTKEKAGVAEIRGRVTLSANASELVTDTDTVFVVAKAASGSPMPLAVLRKPASALPFDFVLNDSLSMVNGKPLSSAAQVVVSVKISSSGDALQTNPGMEASSPTIPATNPPHVALHIDPQRQ